MRLRLLGHQLLLCGGLALTCPLATAQTDEERAGARALAEQGAAAFDDGRWQDAVDLFTRAQSVIDAPPHLLYIARAQEKQGNLVQAMEAYIKVTRTDLDPEAPDAFVEAKADAERELELLTPRIPQVTINLSGEQADDVVVKVDDEELPAAFVGVKRPANPGKHVYSAEGSTVEAPPVTISVGEGGEAVVELVLSQKALAAAPPPEPEVDPGPAPVTPGEPSSVGREGSRMNIPAYAALGVGALGLGAGAYFLYKRSSAQSDADDRASDCEATPGSCDQADVDRILELDDDAASAGTFSLIGFGVGAVGVGVGLTLLLLDGGGDVASTEPSIGVWASGDQVGVAGRF